MDVFYALPARSGAAEKVDLVPFLQSHVGLFPLRKPAGVFADALNFAQIAHDPDFHDLHFKERLDRVLDLDLVGVAPDAEQNLICLLAEQTSLFGHERGLNDFLRLSHAASLSSIARSACSVMMRCS